MRLPPFEFLSEEEQAALIEAARSASERCFLCRWIVNAEHPRRDFGGEADPLFPSQARKDHLVLHHGDKLCQDQSA